MKLSSLQERVDNNKYLWWSIVFIIGILIRFCALYFTNNVVHQHLFLDGTIVAENRNLYANFSAYNYGPFLFLMCEQLYKASLFFADSFMAFKIIYVGVLTLADYVIAKIIENKAGTLWGILFFLNPLSIIVEGYNCQFDNLPVLFGAIGALYASNSYDNNKFSVNDLLCVIFLSLSLITKHFMWAFPLYVLLNTRINTRKKILYAFIPPLLFLLSFIPYWSEGSTGIIHNVFSYRQLENFPLFFIGVIRGGRAYFFGSNTFLLIYGLLVLISAYIFRREDFWNSFLLYTMSSVCLSSSVDISQFVIPIMAMYIYIREKSLPFFPLILLRVINRQLMLSLMAWYVFSCIVYYYRQNYRKN